MVALRKDEEAVLLVFSCPSSLILMSKKMKGSNRIRNCAYEELSCAVVHPAHNRINAAHWISLNLKEIQSVIHLLKHEF